MKGMSAQFGPAVFLCLGTLAVASEDAARPRRVVAKRDALQAGSRLYTVREIEGQSYETPEELAKKQAQFRILMGEAAIAEIEKGFTHPDPRGRTQALMSVLLAGAARPGWDSRVEALLEDPDELVRSAAVLALSSMKPETDAGRRGRIDRLTLAMVKDPSPKVRDQAAAGLIRFRATDRLPLLMERMMRDEAVTTTVVGGLSAWAGEKDGIAIPPDAVAQGLESASLPARRAAAVLAGASDLRALTGKVEALLSDPDDGVRGAAAASFGRLARDPRTRLLSREAGERLVRLLSDAVPSVRASAILGLTGVDAPYADAPLVERIEKDPHDGNKKLATYALKFNDASPAAPEILRIFVSHPDRPARLAAAAALVDPLTVAGNPGVNGSDLWVYLKPAWTDAVAGVMEGDRDPAIRDAAIKILLGARQEGCLDRIAPCLDDPDPQVRTSVAVAVMALGAGDRRALTSATPTIVEEARAWWKENASPSCKSCGKSVPRAKVLRCGAGCVYCPDCAGKLGGVCAKSGTAIE